LTILCNEIVVHIHHSFCFESNIQKKKYVLYSIKRATLWFCDETENLWFGSGVAARSSNDLRFKDSWFDSQKFPGTTSNSWMCDSQTEMSDLKNLVGQRLSTGREILSLLIFEYGKGNLVRNAKGCLTPKGEVVLFKKSRSGKFIHD
jgi:hypothetical protein